VNKSSGVQTVVSWAVEFLKLISKPNIKLDPAHGGRIFLQNSGN
jgi:hypothetical protein